MVSDSQPSPLSDIPSDKACGPVIKITTEAKQTEPRAYWKHLITAEKLHYKSTANEAVTTSTLKTQDCKDQQQKSHEEKNTTPKKKNKTQNKCLLN